MRPRVESVNFRSLWWLVRMEAALRIRFPKNMGLDLLSGRRRLYAELPLTRWARAARVLKFNEARRYYP